MRPILVTVAFFFAFATGIKNPIHFKCPTIKAYADKFVEVIINSPEGKAILEFSKMDAEDNVKNHDEVVLPDLIREGVPHARKTMRKVEDAIRETEGKLELKGALHAVGDGMASVLLRRDLLYRSEAARLGAQNAKDVIQVAKELRVSSRQTALQAIKDGCKRFTSRFGLNIKEWFNEYAEVEIAAMHCYASANC